MIADVADKQAAPSLSFLLAAMALLACALLSIFLSPAFVLAILLSAATVLAVYRYPVLALGIVLAQMPFNYLLVMLGKFFGFPHIEFFTWLKELAPLLVTCVLWRKNGLRLTKPDWFLATFVFLVLIHSAISGGILKGIQYDLEFVLPYLAGRVTVLSLRREQFWAKCSLWIAAIVSVLGMIEVFFIGDAPRTLFYTTLSGEDELIAAFHAGGFAGLRASSTMVGPLEFATFCMVALIIWWVYSANPVPATIIAAGLICSVTRSATLGLFAATSVLAFRWKQKKRFLTCAFLALILLIAAIPVVGLQEYLSLAGKGHDSSTETHQGEILDGVRYVLRHPLGTGPGSVGPLAVARNSSALQIEDTYLAFSAEYGFLAAACFIAFVCSAFLSAWRSEERLGRLTTGILIGFSIVMTVLLIHQDFRLNCWVWFPIGLVVRRGQERTNSGDLAGFLPGSECFD